MTSDLWPDFTIDAKPRGVRQMLREAGNGLKEKTGGLVEFRVQPRGGGLVGHLTFDCELVVPSIDYSFLLLRVDANASGFPVRLWIEPGPTSVPSWVSNEPELRDALAVIFRSERTQQIVQNLISMATD